MSLQIPPTAVALVLTAALAGCETRSQPAPCPGAAVVTLTFAADGGPAPDGGSCASVTDAGLAFTGTIAYGPSSTAFLCLDRPEASPLAGVRDGGYLTLTAPAVAVTADACGCPLLLTEQLEGEVLPGDGGFSGQLSDAFTTPDGGTAGCEKDGGATCGVPCTAYWQVTGTP